MGWLGCDCEGLLELPKQYSSDNALAICRGTGMYDTHTLKYILLESLTTWILHRMITYTLNARRNISDQVTVVDTLIETSIKENKLTWLVG